MAALFLTDQNLETLRSLLAAEVLRVEQQLDEWRMAHHAPSDHEDDITLWLHDVTQLHQAVGTVDE